MWTLISTHSHSWSERAFTSSQFAFQNAREGQMKTNEMAVCIFYCTKKTHQCGSSIKEYRSSLALWTDTENLWIATFRTSSTGNLMSEGFYISGILWIANTDPDALTGPITALVTLTVCFWIQEHTTLYHFKALQTRRTSWQGSMPTTNLTV